MLANTKYELPASPPPAQRASLPEHSNNSLIIDLSSLKWAAILFLRSRVYLEENGHCLDFVRCSHLLHSLEIEECTAIFAFKFQ